MNIRKHLPDQFNQREIDEVNNFPLQFPTKSAHFP